MAASSALTGLSCTPGFGAAVGGAAMGKTMHDAANNTKALFIAGR
jgi:hypothetical protein